MEFVVVVGKYFAHPVDPKSVEQVQVMVQAQKHRIVSNLVDRKEEVILHSVNPQLQVVQAIEEAKEFFSRAL